MPELNRRGFKGLNLLSSEFERDSSYASFCRNVEIDSQKRLKKRFGYTQFSDVSFCLNLIPYTRGNKLLAMTPTGPREYNPNTGTFDAIPRGFTGAVPTWTEAVSWVEYNGCIYWTDPSGVNPLYKYDGYMFYRAGLPTPLLSLVSIGTAGPTEYERYFASFTDAQGNIINSDYVDVSLAGSGIITWTHTPYSGGHFNKSFYGSGVIGGGSTTINLFAANETNFVTGDWIYCYTLTNGVVPVKITNVTALTIVVDDSPLTALGITHTFGVSAEPSTAGQGVRILFYRSNNVSFGHLLDYQTYLLQHKTPTFNIAVTSTPYATLLSLAPPFLDEIYDTNTIKGVPPVAQYCTLYNNHLVLMGFKASIFSAVAVPVDADADDTFYWSDITVGGSVESFAPFDKEVVGNTGEGGITGGFGSTDALTVFKESQVYSITGELFGKAYRIRSSLTNEIGCISHQSIQKFEGGVVFMSARGLYYTTAEGTPLEFSEIVEGLFVDESLELDLTKSRSALDFIAEKMYFFIPTSGSDTTKKIVLMYDYRNKEWFVHDSMEADGGFVVWNRKLYHSEYSGVPAGKVFIQHSEYNDDGCAIKSKWLSGWEKAGLFSTLKKWIRAVLYNFSNQTYTVNITVEHDNIEGVYSTDIEVPMDSGAVVEDPEINMEQTFSMRLGITHEVLDQGFTIDGFDIIYESPQTKVKGEVSP